jgi:hypothetical protein
MTVAENQVLCGAWKDRARCDRGKSALGDGGHVILPTGGRQKSPRAASISPHGRPVFSPPIVF